MSPRGNFARSVAMAIVLVLLSSTTAYSDESFKAKILERIAYERGVSLEKLEVGAFERLTFTLTEVILYQTKIINIETGAVYRSVVDEDGIPRSLENTRRAERAAYEAFYGRLDPDLYDHLGFMETDQRLTVAIWLKASDLSILNHSAFEHQPTTGERGDAELPSPRLVHSQPLGPSEEKEDLWGDEAFMQRIFDLQAQQAMLDAEINATKQVYLKDLEAKVTELQAPLLWDLHEQGYEPLFVSPIAPLIYVELPKSVILELVRREAIDRIYGPHENHDEMDSAKATQKGDVVDSWGFSGSGVNVAFLEDSRIQFDNIYLNSGTTRVPGDANVDDHATAVAGIVASQHSTYQGIAQGVNLFSANATDFTDANLAAAMDWAVSQGVDIINNSWGSNLGTNTLNEHDRHLDYIVRNYRTTVIASAGDGGAGSGRVSSPGRGYNVITVGSYQDNNTTTWTGDSMWSSSSYLNPSTGIEKPEVVSVGSGINSTTASSPWTGNVGSGTSFAAPMVSGEVALLMERDSDLKIWPEAVKAILMATALHNLEGESRLSDVDGAGGVDMRAAFRVVDEGWWGGWQLVSASLPYSLTVYAYEGETIRAVIAWDSNPNGDYSSDALEADLELLVYDPIGSYVTGSTSTNNSYEIIEFTAEMTGDYELLISAASFSGSSEYVGIAWWPGHRVLTAYAPQSLDTPPISRDYYLFSSDDSWNAVGIRSSLDSNYNIYLYSGSAFSNPDEHVLLEDSTYGDVLVDYVIVDGNHTPTGYYYPEVSYGSGSDNYPIEWATHTSDVETGTYGPYSMDPSQVIRVWDVFLDTGVPKYFALKPIAGLADLGMALHASDSDPNSWYQGRSQAVEFVDSTGFGGDEYMDYQAFSSDWMGLVVWNNGASSTTSFYLYADTSAPTGSIAIEDGALFANSTSVNLDLSAGDVQTGVVDMRFLNEGSSWTAWEPYSTTKNWTLPSGDGNKTVYVQFRNNAGMISSTFYDSIYLDTIAPTGTILIEDGATYATSTVVNLTLSASDIGSDVAEMCFSNDGIGWEDWEIYATDKSWTLPSVDGTRIVYVKYRDSAWNISTSYSDTIVLDTVSPTGSILIDDDATYANSTLVELTLSASDAGSGVVEMRFSDDESDWTLWEVIDTSRSWSLPSGDGSKTVIVQFKDGAGIISSPYNDTIVLDSTAPGSSANSPESTHSLSFEVSWSGSDGLSGVASYDVQYRIGTNMDWSDWLVGTSSTSATFGSESPVNPVRGETYYFRVRAYDHAGNVEDYTSSPDTSTFVEEIVEIFLPLVER